MIRSGTFFGPVDPQRQPRASKTLARATTLVAPAVATHRLPAQAPRPKATPVLARLANWNGPESRPVLRRIDRMAGLGADRRSNE